MPLSLISITGDVAETPGRDDIERNFLVLRQLMKMFPNEAPVNSEVIKGPHPHKPGNSIGSRFGTSSLWRGCTHLSTHTKNQDGSGEAGFRLHL